MRKITLLSAIAAGALMAGCAQTGNTAQMDPACERLTNEAFMKAVEMGSCDLDVTTAAGGPSKEPFGNGHDHDGSDDDGEGGEGGEGGGETPKDPEGGDPGPSTAPHI